MIGKRFLSLYAKGMEARVMAEAEGWVLARFKGCVPFVVRRADFDKRFAEITAGEGVNAFKENEA